MTAEREHKDTGGAGESWNAKDQRQSAGGDSPPARQMEICVWCLNNDREICVMACQPEGKYRHLEPVVLATGELPPSLPPHAEFVGWRSSAKLAMLYLMAYYQDWLAKRE